MLTRQTKDGPNSHKPQDGTVDEESAAILVQLHLSGAGSTARGRSREIKAAICASLRLEAASPARLVEQVTELEDDLKQPISMVPQSGDVLQEADRSSGSAPEEGCLQLVFGRGPGEHGRIAHAQNMLRCQVMVL